MGMQTFSFAVDMWSVGCIFAELLARTVVAHWTHMATARALHTWYARLPALRTLRRTAARLILWEAKFQFCDGEPLFGAHTPWRAGLALGGETCTRTHLFRENVTGRETVLRQRLDSAGVKTPLAGELCTD